MSELDEVKEMLKLLTKKIDKIEKKLFLENDEIIITELKKKGKLSSTDVTKISGCSRVTALTKMQKLGMLEEVKYIKGDPGRKRAAQLVWKEKVEKDLERIKQFIQKNSPCPKSAVMQEFKLSLDEVNSLVTELGFMHKGGGIVA